MRSSIAVAFILAACSASTVPGPTGGGSGTSGGSATAGGMGTAGGTGGTAGGTGGTAGGTGGTAGGTGSTAGGSASASCTTLETSYTAAIATAKLCNTFSLVNPCTATRPAIISCGCPTFIDPNNAAPVDAIQNSYTDAGCVMTSCPRCAPLDAGTCEPIDAGSPGDGICVDRR
ncbi:MAG: hypothetical protein JNK82_31280 [Myxococcaceae bacterium]|nr:hypothetical protein [Myxococcaceae bacterium]